MQDEDRDVWRAKLEKGEFADALRFAKVRHTSRPDSGACVSDRIQTKPQKDVVLSRQGDSLFEQGRFIQAAQCYAKCSRSFEYVALRFIDADERDALRIYLSDRLDILDKRASQLDSMTTTVEC